VAAGEASKGLKAKIGCPGCPRGGVFI
jgi:hypothetical protein